MSHELVMLLTDEDEIAYDEPVWCLVSGHGSDPARMCTNEYFGYGQGAATYETKTVKRGGITCERCLVIVREHKAIKL